MNCVYFYSNTDPDCDRYGLWLTRSLNDLAKIPNGPKDGMLITIYMIGEIEMEATLEFDPVWATWTARPSRGTVRENTEKWE
jgi:hypothetical protein